uniref:Uncharacterized protein n=1 Tax=Astyanax mexicanus TaxID=7994 RepID=A0A3B1J7L7_ASTMX
HACRWKPEPLNMGDSGAKVLPPPGIVNRNSVWLGFCGWITAVLNNSYSRRPALKAECCGKRVPYKL